MIDENQICSDYFRTQDVVLSAQLSGITREEAVEILSRHGYDPKIPKPRTKRKPKESDADKADRIAAKRAKSDALDAEILALHNMGLSACGIANKLGMFHQTVRYRLMKMLDPENTIFMCADMAKEKAASECKSQSGKPK